MPFQFAAGRKRSKAELLSSKALLVGTDPRALQLAPPSAEYCHSPLVASMVLALTATPARVLPSTSENFPDSRLATVAPAGLVASSATAASVGRLPDAALTGASATGVTVTVMDPVAVCAAPPVLPRSLATTVMVSVAELVLLG